MRAIRLSMLLAAFAALAAARGAAAPSDPWRDVWAYGEDPLWSKYEDLFDQPFPVRPYDVFHRSHPFYEVQAFNRAFDLRAAGVSWRVDETEAGASLAIYWPGSAERPLDVSVERGLVRLRPSAPPPQANGPYRFYASDSRALAVPLPPDVQTDGAKVTREADLIRVDFPKR